MFMLRKRIRKFVVLLVVLAPFVSRAFGQSVTGLERNVPYNPPTATLASNWAALVFAQGGQNTFLLDVQPTLSAKISITNETANGCLGAFSVSIYSTPTKSNTFQNALQVWQLVPLVGGNGSYVASAPVDLPANTTVYINSSAISASRIAIQIVNQTGSCASTSIDVSVVFSIVALTTPLLSVNGGVNDWGSSNVQGVLPSGANGAPVLPIVDGALQPAVNAGFLSYGIDNLGASNAGTPPPVNANAVFSLATPPPSTLQSFSIGFLANSLAGTSRTLLGPWSCIESSCLDNSLPSPVQLANNLAGNRLSLSVGNVTTGNVLFGEFLVFNNRPTVRQHNTANSVVSSAFGLQVLQGSTMVAAISCSTAACVVAPTDGPGNTWRQVLNQLGTGGCSSACTQSMSVWVASASSTTGITVTFNAAGGTTINGSSILELAGVTPANLNQPLSPLLADRNGSLLMAGANLQFSPLQLGVSAITLPASGTTSLSGIIDTRGAKETTLAFVCTQGAVTVNVQEYAEDGVTPLALVSPLSAVALNTQTQLTIGSESNPSSSSGTLSSSALVRLPQRAVAFSFTNASAVAGTCTARLFEQF
jgi:hypothetical protein